jgi:hypothetical protein
MSLIESLVRAYLSDVVRVIRRYAGPSGLFADIVRKLDAIRLCQGSALHSETMKLFEIGFLGRPFWLLFLRVPGRDPQSMIGDCYTVKNLLATILHMVTGAAHHPLDILYESTLEADALPLAVSGLRMFQQTVA